MSEQKKQSFPTYKGKPLVRSGDTIYYGSMKDKYVIKMDIKSKKKVGDLEVADKVTVQLMYTDPEIRTRKQIVKTSEKNGLYLALDIAEPWQTRALDEQQTLHGTKGPPQRGRPFFTSPGPQRGRRTGTHLKAPLPLPGARPAKPGGAGSAWPGIETAQSRWRGTSRR